MFSEIVKLRPQLDRAALTSMFQSLNQRFGQVAKRFGNGMKNALKLAPIAAIAGAVLTKLLNPLQKAEEIINRITGKAGDTKDLAEELGTDPGKLFRLQQLAQSKGLDDATTKDLLIKFQSALAQEQQATKTGKQAGVLREFVNETDTAEAFMKFVHSLQKTDKATQVVIQEQIFSERLRGRTSQFFNAPAEEFTSILKQLPTAERLTAAINRADKVGERGDILKVIREAQDFEKKSFEITPDMADSLDRSERLKLREESTALAQFDDAKSTSIAIQELTATFNEGMTEIMGEVLPAITNGISKITETVAMLSVKLDDIWSQFKSSKIYKFGFSFFGGK